MSDVRANIPELEVFERNLAFMSNMLRENYTKLKSQMARIDDTWRDQENTKFMNDFIPKADKIFDISEQMMEYSKFIKRKTNHLKDYTR